MRVGAQAGRARHLAAEAVELLGREPALEERARIVARGGVALEVDEIAAAAVARRVPEVVEADLVERRQRLVGRDVAAELRGDLVGAHDHRYRVPAHDRAQPTLERGIAREPRLLLGCDRVDVRGVEAGDRAGALMLCALYDPGQELPRSIRPVMRDDRVQRLEPLAGLLAVDVGAGSVGGDRSGYVGHGANSLYPRPTVPLEEVDAPLGPPWGRQLSGSIERLVVKSDVLAENPLGDPAQRPLHVYRSPGVGGESRAPAIYVLQGYTGQLDMWLA